VTDMYRMFWSAYSFNQNLCTWGKIPTFPYDTVDVMFSGSGCTYKSSPIRTNKGPFCASDCISSESPTQRPTRRDATCGSGSVGNGLCPIFTDCCTWWGECGTGYGYCGFGGCWDPDPDPYLYSNSKESQNENIANESHQQSVKATVLARASTSSTTSTARSSSSSKGKPTLSICYYAGTNKCPTKPGTNTAVSCSCKK
jgi:hypothetical protein